MIQGAIAAIAGENAGLSTTDVSPLTPLQMAVAFKTTENTTINFNLSTV
jgi:hypothetical protein